MGDPNQPKYVTHDQFARKRVAGLLKKKPPQTRDPESVELKSTPTPEESSASKTDQLQRLRERLDQTQGPAARGVYYEGTKCGKCGAVISPSAISCPRCRKFYGLIGAERAQNPTFWILLVLALILILLFGLPFGSRTQRVEIQIREVPY